MEGTDEERAGRKVRGSVNGPRDAIVADATSGGHKPGGRPVHKEKVEERGCRIPMVQDTEKEMRVAQKKN